MSVMPPHRSGSPAPGARRPDASMSLLTNVMEHSLDEGYAEAAARRGEVGSSRMPVTLRARLVLALGLVLVTLVMTVGAVRSHEAAPREAGERAALARRIDRQTAVVDRKEDKVDALRREVAGAQRKALRGGGSGVAPERVQVLAGEVPVTGPGLRLTVDDADGTGGGGGGDPRDREDFGDTGRVRDRDLQRVVNGLWEAGAEAVSVNGQRLTSLSAIRAAGDAVLVDNRPLAPPYRILAIGGGGERFAARFRKTFDGLYLKELRSEYGIRSSIAVLKSVKVPAATGVSVRYAQPLTGGRGAGTGKDKDKHGEGRN